MSKKISVSVAATVALIAMAVTFSLTMAFAMNRFNGTVTSVKDKERMYNKLAEIDRYVRANAYYDINDDTLNDTIGSGYMLGISDKYARYYSARAYAERQGLASGRLMGIGVSVVRDPSSGYARILRVYENSPADEMGLQAGGFITVIGETSTRTMADAAAMSSALVGEEGTSVTLGYLTPDRQETTVELRRANYTVTTVTARLLESGCGYLRVDAFNESTGTELRTAVDGLLQRGAACFVFDLRDNTGESLNAALVAADRCVPAGLLAQSRSRDGTATDLRVSDEQEITVPMVCLVNGGTAGGAELFANALRKMGGALLVGTNTAGRGVVLSEPQSFSDGSAVVITTGILLDGEGAAWDGTGLAPDIEAALSADEQSLYYDFTVDDDPQIQRAVNAALGAAGIATAPPEEDAPPQDGQDEPAGPDTGTPDAGDGAEPAA